MSNLPRLLDQGRGLADRAAYEVKTIVARYPSAAVPVARWRRRGELVHDRTDILIEGYPRSANSFCVAAFRLAQDGPVDVAQHTHAPGHVIAALRLGIPSIILVRDPEEAVLEFVIAKPRLTPRQALRGWVRFYATLLPRRAEFVVGAFPEVTSDFGAVIRRVNDRFGTSFKEFEHTKENVQECFRQMDAYWRELLGPHGSVERYVGRPSEERELMKDRMRGEYVSGVPAGVRAHALALYRSYADDGGA